MILSEKYKKRLMNLAGIITEELYKFTDEEKKIAYKDFDKRVPFSKDLMAKAIREGWEIGINFKTDNDKNKMPIAKARIIYPVAMGLSKKGNLVIRAFHKLGQSESAAGKAQKQGLKNYRSTEVKDEWRLFKATGIKNMWFTGNFFKLENVAGYKEISDKGMTVVEIQAKKKQVSSFQKDYFSKIQDTTEKTPETVIVKNKPIEGVAKEPVVTVQKKPEQQQQQNKIDQSNQQK